MQPCSDETVVVLVSRPCKHLPFTLHLPAWVFALLYLEPAAAVVTVMRVRYRFNVDTHTQLLNPASAPRKHFYVDGMQFHPKAEAAVGRPETPEEYPASGSSAFSPQKGK